MALPFLSGGGKKRDQIVAIDLGTRNTKAVHVSSKGGALFLNNFVVMDAPVYDRAMSAEVLADHLKTVMESMEAKTRYLSLSLGAADALLRHAELPVVGINDMRQMLRFGSKNYLQQDMPDHLFDCHILAVPQGEAAAKGAKCRVLVGGAKKPLVTEVQAAAKQAGLHAEFVTTCLIGPANALEAALPDVFTQEIIALVDFGYKNSSISIMLQGEMALSRVVGYGAAKLTTGIAETLGISTAEAEGVKIGMAQEVQEAIQPLLTPLGRELRASIDFFEHQQDKTVSQVFFSGGSAKAEPMVQALQSELMVPCKSWNPTSSLTLALDPQKMSEVELAAPQLAVAVGAALAAF
jgi:type IV pilus assembly protein PilM